MANIHNISMAPLYLDILGNIMATNNSVNRVNRVNSVNGANSFNIYYMVYGTDNNV